MFQRGLLVLLLMAPPAVTAIVTRLNELPRRFAEVVPATIYRGGRPTAVQIETLRKEKNVRTLVNLTEPKETTDERESARAAGELNMRVLRFPMPGNGTGEFAVLDTAADAINDPSNQPLYFHCAAGKQRSNAALAAYRMKHCGWTLAQALAELEDKYELEREGEERVLVEHLTSYARWLEAQSGREIAISKDTIPSSESR
ncbi:MAG TPA: hypothetical protein VNT79_15850 [Phycisphaerae bacterium]|nr:hypothetical protein [Phycisphaerae bacterium]